MTGHCFTKADNARLTFRVFASAAPPGNDNVTNVTYPHWPATNYSASRAVLTTSTYSEPGHGRELFVWANRRNFGDGNFNRKPNDAPGGGIESSEGYECRATFTSIGLANAATRISLRYILGIDYSGIVASHPNLTVYTFAEWNDPARRDAIFDEVSVHGGVAYKTGRNIVLLMEPMDASKLTGVKIDYEPQDNRTSAQTDAILALLLKDIHGAGKEAFLLVNPYNQPGAVKSGITVDGLAAVLESWDWLTLWLHTENVAGSIRAAYDAQVAMLPDNMTAEQWAKIVLRFELGGDPDAADPGTTLEDAAWVYAKLTEPGDRHPAALQLHRSLAEAGGVCDSYTNQKIALAVFGGTP